MTVVPGMMIRVSRQTWHGLRNTGTGVLQILWTAAPPGIEEFFRELSRLGTTDQTLATAAVQELARRYGVEFGTQQQPEIPTPSVVSTHHRQRRRGRRSRGGDRQTQTQAQSTHAQAAQQTVSEAARPQQPPPESSQSVQQTTHQKTAPHRERPSKPHAKPHQVSPASESTNQAQSSSGQPPSTGGAAAKRRFRHHRARIKEVYMGGRWIQVKGDGPVISSNQTESDNAGEGE